MNRLVAAGESAWRLPHHAHIVAYTGDRPLLTIYRCGADDSPAAQIRGALGRIDAAHDRLSQPTGAIYKLHEPATLRQLADDRFAIGR